MAKMIPNTPRYFPEESRENIIFEALQKRLSPEFTVIHSYHIIYKENGRLIDNQCDFLIFHPELGFLSIESKYGSHISYHDGCWYYGSGAEMSPFDQADTESKNLAKFLVNRNIIPDLRNRCKFVFGVWFHGMDRKDIPQEALNENYVADLLLTKDDLVNPEPAIRRIFNSTKFARQPKTNFSQKQVNLIINNILDVQFDMVSSYSNVDRELAFLKLLDEQKIALDFMKDEKSVTVIGGAGTGKTIIALEQAKKIAKEKKNVLFLCYNAMLCEKLQNDVKSLQLDTYIHVYDCDGFVVRLCNGQKDYKKAQNIIDAMYGEIFKFKGIEFEYVIVDEAQDFGRDDIEESKLLETLQAVVTDGSESGSFYAFYDKLQYIHSEKNPTSTKLPKIIENSLCRIPLKTNCRNTSQIIFSANKPFLEQGKMKKYENKHIVLNKIDGEIPTIHFCEKDQLKTAIDNIISTLRNQKNLKRDEIVLLTLKTEKETSLHLINKDNKNYYDGCLFTTCRRFKGLEATAVILVDLDKTIFSNDINTNLFYVGASRARYYLDFVTTITGEETKEILIRDFKYKEEEIYDDPRLILSELLGTNAQEG